MDPLGCSTCWEPVHRDFTVAKPKSPILTVQPSWRKMSGNKSQKTQQTVGGHFQSISYHINISQERSYKKWEWQRKLSKENNGKQRACPQDTVDWVNKNSNLPNASFTFKCLFLRCFKLASSWNKGTLSLSYCKCVSLHVLEYRHAVEYLGCSVHHVYIKATLLVCG